MSCGLDRCLTRVSVSQLSARQRAIFINSNALILSFAEPVVMRPTRFKMSRDDRAIDCGGASGLNQPCPNNKARKLASAHADTM